MPRQGAGWAAGAQAVENPAAFAKAIEETGLAEQLQMPRHPRLALSENLRQLADRQLAARAQDQQAQSAGLGDRAQGAEHLLHRDAGRGSGFGFAGHA